MILIFLKPYYMHDLKGCKCCCASFSCHIGNVSEQRTTISPVFSEFICCKWSRSKNQQKESAEIWISFHLCAELCHIEWKANVVKQQLRLHGESLKEVSSYSGSSHLSCETVIMPVKTPPFLFWGGVWAFCFALGFFCFALGFCTLF